MLGKHEPTHNKWSLVSLNINAAVHNVLQHTTSKRKVNDRVREQQEEVYKTNQNKKKRPFRQHSFMIQDNSQVIDEWFCCHSHRHLSSFHYVPLVNDCKTWHENRYLILIWRWNIRWFMAENLVELAVMEASHFPCGLCELTSIGKEFRCSKCVRTSVSITDLMTFLKRFSALWRSGRCLL